MGHRTIPQRELRNNVTAVLREAESGTVFTVTVRGRPVA
jgi:prevent-host-death family protein